MAMMALQASYILQRASQSIVALPCDDPVKFIPSRRILHEAFEIGRWLLRSPHPRLGVVGNIDVRIPAQVAAVLALHLFQ